jgi:hypothetical protein
MNKFCPFQQLILRRSGFAVSLLALFVIAPIEARGGCSHLVTSRSQRAQTASLVDAFDIGMSKIDFVRSEAPSAPLNPRPCSGTWCSGQRSAPVTPTGARDRRSEAWAWQEALPGSNVFISLAFSVDEDDLRPLQPDGCIFRPPRLLPSV